MKEKRKIINGFILSSGFFCLISLAVILMSLLEHFPESFRQSGSVISGLLFWVGFIGGIVSYVILYKKNRTVICRDIAEKRKPGVLCFFGNPPAKIADVILIGSLIMNLIGILWFRSNVWLGWIAILLLVTSAYMHVLLNGKIFNYIIHSTRREGHEYGREKDV